MMMVGTAAGRVGDDSVVAEIGDIAGVAEVTIKHSYKLMLPRAHDLFPEDFHFTTPLEQLPI